MNEIKDYLSYENARNKRGTKLFKRLLELAFDGKARHEQEFVGHHITFEFDGEIETDNEIPSADTLIFDHDIMTKVFGVEAMMVMRRLALVPADRREQLLENLMKELGI